MFTYHSHCRACNYAFHGAGGNRNPTEKLIEAFDLGIQPLANSFASVKDKHPGFAPLKVLFCPRCSLAQLSIVVDPKILYRHYSYVTSPSDTMREHFQQLMQDIATETDGKSVMEIGSNDGRLLAEMKRAGYSVFGVDPASNLAAIAKEQGVPTQVGFFGEDLARVLPKFDIIIARHVFCHVDDWHDFVRGLESLSHPETLVCIEVPYAVDMIAMNSWDQCYHEHTSYLTLKAMAALLENSGLHMHSVRRYPIHGGAILISLRRDDSSVSPDASVEEMLGRESITAKTWQDFAARATEQQGKLKSTIEVVLRQGKRVAGLGASAKSTVWINACGLTRNHIAFIADNTPHKQYTFSPGTDIAIVDEGAILRELPDYVVMWCWNFKQECLAKFSLARSKGLKFIIPVPTVEIV